MLADSIEDAHLNSAESTDMSQQVSKMSTPWMSGCWEVLLLTNKLLFIVLHKT